MSTPRLNHVALSLPAERLDDHGRAEIIAFYREVFGWDEMPTMTEPGRRLVLQMHRYDQFLFLVADDEPMRCPRLDHFGVSVGALEELEACYDRAVAYRSRDDRVELIEPHVDDFEVLKLHNFYVGYLLPLMVEVQHWEWASSANGPATADAGSGSD